MKVPSYIHLRLRREEQVQVPHQLPHHLPQADLRAVTPQTQLVRKDRFVVSLAVMIRVLVPTQKVDALDITVRFITVHGKVGSVLLGNIVDPFPSHSKSVVLLLLVHFFCLVLVSKCLLYFCTVIIHIYETHTTTTTTKMLYFFFVYECMNSK